MWTAPRPGGIRCIVIHTNEGPEGPTSAENLASYLRSISGGYHYVVDENSFVRCAPDSLEVAGGPPEVNPFALAICITGYAAQDLTQWEDASSQAALDLLEQLVAQWCMTYGIPAVHLTPDQLYYGGRGLAGHADGTLAYRRIDSTLDHYDPGPSFPWPEVVAKVQHYIDPTPQPAPAPPPPPKPHEAPMLFKIPTATATTDADAWVSDNPDGLLVCSKNAKLFRTDGTAVTLKTFGEVDLLEQSIYLEKNGWQYRGGEWIEKAGARVGIRQAYLHTADGGAHFREWYFTPAGSNV